MVLDDGGLGGGGPGLGDRVDDPGPIGVGRTG